MTKLNRSETVTVRLDPRLNYLTEIAGRSQRRTKSSFVEWAVQEAIRKLGIDEGLLEWRPIETAPKDGTVILVWTTTRIDPHDVEFIARRGMEHADLAQISHWDDEDPSDQFWSLDTMGKPTHWMPLPRGPE